MSDALPLTVISTREFQYARATVFEAFSDPEQLRHWWGPKDFTNTFEKFDLRPDGEWLFVMHAPNGADYSNRKQFTEVLVPERVVYKHFQPMHTFTMVMNFDEVSPSGARLTWRMDFEPSGQNAKLKDFIAHANEENFDRLQAHLLSHSKSP